MSLPASSAPLSFAAPATFSASTVSYVTVVTTIKINGVTIQEISFVPSNAAGASSTTSSITVANIQAMTPQQISQLSTSAVAGLSTAVLQAISTTQMAALLPAQLNALNAAQFSIFSAKQIAALGAAQMNALGQSQIQAIASASFTTAQLAAMSATVIGELSVTQFDALFAPHLSTLTNAQVAGLTAAQLQSLTTAQFKALTSAEIAALSAAQIASLTSAEIATLTTAEIAALTNSQMGGLSPQLLAALTTAQVAAFSTTQMAALTTAQIGGFTGAQLNAMSGAQLGALNPLGLTAAQIGALSASAIASLSVKAFDALIVPHIASLSVQAVQGISVADLSSMTTAQLSTFTAAQVAGMTAQDALIVRAAQLTNPVLADANSRLSGGSLSFASLQAILQDADTAAMNANEFQGLRTLASELNVAGGITTTAYAQQMFDNVVLGNAANAWWNGGTNSAVSLGNLSATSSQTQLSELIGKWFLGTDNPGVGSGAEGFPTSYAAVTGNLWGSSGPAATDINQGQIGDCYFVSALGELALQNPTAIKNMITQNANGSYSVEFQVNGHADWVTVNNQLAQYSGGGRSGTVFEHGKGALWAPLVEKAYVELLEQLGAKGSNYNNIDGGADNGLQVVTGQSDTWMGFTPHESTSALQSLLGTLQTAFNSKEEILFASQTNNSAANLVGSHMYFVTGVNAAAGTVSLENPWGSNGAGSGLQMTFTDTIATLAAQSGDGFYVTSGKPTLA